MTSRLARSAGLIGIATTTSRLLGLVRDRVLAHFFGAGDAMDAFNVAARIPNLVRDLFAEGAMSAAFVPTFTRELTTRGKERAWRLGSQALNALAIATSVIVLLGIVFAWPLSTFYAGSFDAVPGKLELTASLTRIMFPFLTMVAIAVAFMGMLNSLGRFFVPALSPAMFNVAVILSALLIAPLVARFGIHPIFGIAIGTLLGGLGQIALQWPALRAEGFRHRWRLDPHDPALREILVLMGPGTIGVAATQINLFVNTVLATGQGTGAVSWLNYAFRLMYLPIGLFGVSIATAALPDISRHAARESLADVRQTISYGLRMMLMFNVPAAVGLVALASPIVGLILESGAFTETDTIATAGALVYYAPGLLGYSAVKIATPSFYALRDARTPVLVSMLAVGTNLVLNLTLVQILGYLGLALGTALAALVNAGVLLVLLRRRLEGLDEQRLAVAFGKIALASAVMGLAAWGVERAMWTFVPGTGWMPRGVRVFSAIAVALVVLAGAARALRIREFEDASRRVLQRLKR
ncbi:MAG: murein biosynthesis integral membrane protein MurJ [Vicinamibacterales bacterium]